MKRIHFIIGDKQETEAYHSCCAETKQQQQDSSSADYNKLYGKDD